MSYTKISRDEAQAIIDNLKEQNIHSSKIRKRMMDEGFSFAEISEMLDEEQASTKQTNSPYSKFKHKKSKHSSSFTYPEPLGGESTWGNIVFVNNVVKFGLLGIGGAIGFFVVLFSEDASLWALCAFPLLAVIGFTRLWFLFER